MTRLVLTLVAYLALAVGMVVAIPFYLASKALKARSSFLNMEC